MNEKQRIAELEAKLASIQKDENNGRDPEMWAKAKNLARMAWMDVSFTLENAGYAEIGTEDVKLMQEALVQRKYDYLVGANKTALSWVA